MVVQSPEYQVVSYAVVAAAALFWYDWLLTIPDEVQRLWQRPFTGASVIYILIRYTFLVQQAFVLLGGLPLTSSGMACFAILQTSGVLLVSSNIASSVLIILRVYAVCARNWRPLLLIVPIALTHPVLGIMFDLQLDPYWFRHGFKPSPGCKPIVSGSGVGQGETLNTFYYIRLLITMVANALLVAITWYKTLGLKRAFAQTGVRAPLTTMMVRDGAVYFLLLIANAAVNVPSMAQTWNSRTYLVFSQAWTYFYPVFNVIVLSRFVLALRGIYFNSSASQDLDDISSVRFQGSRVLGNLGATVDPDVPDGSAEDEAGAEEPEYSTDPFREGMREAVQE